MNLIERAKNILLTPAAEWEKIKNETYTPADLFTKYAVILAAIPAVVGFIGNVAVGYSLGMLGRIRLPIGNALLWAILTYVLSLAGAFLFAFVLDALAPSFGGSKDLNAYLKIVIFSMTASWLAGVLYIIPSLATIAMIAGFYGIYLLYLGIKICRDIPADKLMGFIIVSIIAFAIINWLIYYIVRSIAFGGGAALL